LTRKSTDIWALELADHVAKRSKDPSTQCGAVILDGKRVVSLGYNGFPQGVEDSEYRLKNRATKLMFIEHAERNALHFAERSVSGMTLYVTMPPCNECAKAIIQRGIKRVVYWKPVGDVPVRWAESFHAAKTMFFEADVKFSEVSNED